jgi:hypothetical protein
MAFNCRETAEEQSGAIFRNDVDGNLLSLGPRANDWTVYGGIITSFTPPNNGDCRFAYHATPSGYVKAEEIDG